MVEHDSSAHTSEEGGLIRGLPRDGVKGVDLLLAREHPHAVRAGLLDALVPACLALPLAQGAHPHDHLWITNPNPKP